MQYIMSKITSYLDISIDIEKVSIAIAKLYLFLLPIKMISPLFFLRVYFGVCANYFDFFFHVIGLFLIAIKSKGIVQFKKDEVSKLYYYFVFMVACYNLSSLCMAVVIQHRYGNIGNESAFDGILGMLIYFTQYALIIFYNKEIFRKISIEEIVKILKIVVLYLFVLGYFQILVINFGGVFATVYDRMDVFNILVNSNMSKLCLTGSEGAAAGTLIATFVLPFIMSRIFVEKRKFIYFLFLLGWLPIIYFTNSSSAYIGAAIDLAVFAFLYYKKHLKNVKVILFLVLITITSIIVFAFSPVMEYFEQSNVAEQIDYLLFSKVTDKTNGSTVSRTVPLLVNWGAFKEYPLFGVGNGNQGYFYEKYFPSYAYNAKGSDVFVFLERSKSQISNGAVFFPSILSGYGLFGSVLFLIFFIKCIKLVISSKEKLGSFYFMFFISWIALLVSGFQSDYYGIYYVWFLFSIPFMVVCKNDQKPCISKKSEADLCPIN